MKSPFQLEDATKNDIVKKRHFSFRLNLFFFCTFMLFSILIVRLAMLQFVEGAELKKLEGLSTEKHNPIPPIRGNIYDRKGYPIAYSESTQSLFFRIERGQKQDEVIALANQLADFFAKFAERGKTPLTAAEIIKRMDVGYDLEKNPTKDAGYNFLPRRIKADLTNDEIAYLYENRDKFKWIEVTEESIRHYNEHMVAAQLVGYLRPYSTAREDRHGLAFYQEIAKKKDDPTIQYLDNEDVGFDGLEYMYQEELRGKNGVKSYPVNAVQKIIGEMTITPPVKGNNLYLTIDKDIQLTAEEAIIKQIEYIRSDAARQLKWPYAPNVRAGYAVAMEVQTGRVVAMASMPDYNTNLWRGGISEADLHANQFYMKNGTISEARPNYSDPKELAKHPTSLVYLGSTIKPLSVLIGLNEGLISTNEKYYDSGEFFFGRDNKVRIGNSDSKAYGPINASEAVWHSSNTYMSEMIGNRLYFNKKNGLEIWDSYMEQFGLGVSTESGLPNESRGLKDYNAEAKNGSLQSALVRASWGQLGKYTTLQLAQYAAMLGNRGQRLKPLFVEKITSHDDETLEQPEKVVLNEVKMPKEYWDAVESGMEKVNKQGFEGFPYRVAAKTGTSTQSVAGKMVDNAVFIAYAPIENPTLAVAVVIPEGGYGAWGAAPIARKMFDAYDQQIGLDGVPKAVVANPVTTAPISE